MDNTTNTRQDNKAEARLIMEGITVNYGDFVANDNVNLVVYPGQIKALLGENGAGKTTLMKVLAGLLHPEGGRIIVDGQEVSIDSPQDSQRLGIGMVHQHFMLIPKLTVAQNICIGLKSTGYPFPDVRKVEEELSELSEQYNLLVDPKAVVSTLSIGTQQRVEILKALYRGAKILILDEPTSILTPQETAGLFDIIHFLTKRGNSVIFISHKLNEVMEISDRITVLRQGHVTAELAKQETTERQLAILMVGREFQTEKHLKPVPENAKELVCLDNITYIDHRKVSVLNGINLTVKAGEIHSIAGVDGNGQVELASILSGLLHQTKGKFTLNGKDLSKASPKERLQAGLAHIPSDRHKYGMILDLSMEDNFIIEGSEREPVSHRGILQKDAITSFSENLVKDYDIRCESVKQKASTLSGGNQQKLVLARELSRNPIFVLAMQPAHGLDVGATEFVHKKLIEQRNAGSAVLLISTELDEVFDLSDRISVIYEGRILATIKREEATRENIGLLMTGKTNG